MWLDTTDLVLCLSGKNRTFIDRVKTQQEEKYGNVDIFEARVDESEVKISFGDYYITFSFDLGGNLIDTYGNGQGHKYHKNLESCAIELNKKYRNGELQAVIS